MRELKKPKRYFTVCYQRPLDGPQGVLRMKSSLFYSPRNLQRKNQPPHHHEIREGLCQHVKCLYTWMKNRHTKYLLKFCNAMLLSKSIYSIFLIMTAKLRGVE